MNIATRRHPEENLQPRLRLEETLVQIRDLHLSARIGILPHEQIAAQPLILDVTIATRPVRQDDIATALDYRLIRDEALRLAQIQIGLIETFAERLARFALNHPAALRAEVTLRKPQALPDAMAGTSIRMSRIE